VYFKYYDNIKILIILQLKNEIYTSTHTQHNTYTYTHTHTKHIKRHNQNNALWEEKNRV